MERTRQPKDDPLVFGPWTRGLINNTNEHFIPRDALLRADNVLIDQLGWIETRPTYDLLDAAHYKSLVAFNGLVYGVRENEVGIVGPDAFTSIAAVSGPVDWTVLDGELVFTDFAVNKKVLGDSLEDLPTGYFDGDEQQQYQLAPLPAGSSIWAWNGRLLVTRGRVLYWSEPLHYGVYSQTRGRYQFGEPIVWIAPLASGVYVGLRNYVVFLAGSDPNTFQRRTVGGRSAPGASAVLDKRFSGSGDEVAVWFTDVGFAVGKAGGAVEFPQADRLKGLPLLPGKLVIDKDRVFYFAMAEF